MDNSITEEAVVARNEGNNHEEEAVRKSLKVKLKSLLIKLSSSSFYVSTTCIYI